MARPAYNRALPHEEAEFRTEIARAMRGYWLLTWHEDREINPGVPDLSYVFRGGRHQTGWLELKAIRWPDSDRFKFTLEPSQYQWIRDHCEHVPVHMLLASGRMFWLVNGRHAAKLDSALTLDELNALGEKYDRSAMRDVLVIRLRQETLKT